MAFKMQPLAGVLLASLALAAPLAGADTVKIAVIDGFSGGFAPIVNSQFKSLQIAAEFANQNKWAGDHTLEYVQFDSKGSPQETATQLKVAVEQGYRYVALGGGSAIGIALLDAVGRHNQRNPGKEVVYLNHGAIDPVMTNGDCSFWHFAFDANVTMKLQGLTSYLAKNKNIKKVYIIGQNYSHGQAVSKLVKEQLKAKRPDIEIVGDDLHPTAQVKDFSPYVAKIKASGADAVVTGNWGNDLALLIKAAKDADLDAPFYAFYANNTGVPTAMGEAGVGRVYNLTYWNPNDATGMKTELVEAFKKKFGEDYVQMPTFSAVRMLSQAIKETGSTDPVKVAFAMDNMSIESLNGTGSMRASDHQYQQPMFITTWRKQDGDKVRYDQEGTGYGWLTEETLPASELSTPTTCQMKRPAKP